MFSPVFPAVVRPVFDPLGVAPVPSFDPQLTGCTLALWADEITGATDGAALGTWSDTSGNGLHMTGSGAGVTYEADGGPNGLAAVAFDGVHKFSRTGVNWSDFIAADEGTFVAVMRQAGASAENTLLHWRFLGDEELWLGPTLSNILFFDWDNVTTGRLSVAQPAGWDDAWHIVLFVRRADGTQIIRTDGVTRVSASKSAVFTTANTQTLTVGAYGTIRILEGGVHALHAYNHGFDAAEIDFIEAGWSDYTGITI